MLPDVAATLEDDTPPETSNTSDKDDGLLLRDKQRKTAYYDYATDRSLSHADAKLFYQRSQLEAQKTGGSNWDSSQQSAQGSPILHPKGFGSVYEAEQAGMRRTGSVKSMQSGQNPIPRSVGVISVVHYLVLTIIVPADINRPSPLVWRTSTRVLRVLSYKSLHSCKTRCLSTEASLFFEQIRPPETTKLIQKFHMSLSPR